VRGGVHVTRDRRTTAAGSIVEEGEVDSNGEGGLCCDAGCDEIRAEGECALSVRKNRAFSAAVQWPIGRWKDRA
jgi:hypothetical protein